MKVDYHGTERHVNKRAHYPSPPELGTIVGPNDISEHLVVLGQDGADTLLGYATVHDLAAAQEHVRAGNGPRSVTEAKIR